MLKPQDLAKKVGRKVLFIGVECVNWAVLDFAKAARNAKALGFDSIAPKRADGANRWYQTPGHLALERQACLSEGVGFVPFLYGYGPAFGDTQIDMEVGVAKEMASVCDGVVCLDLEVEWNGQNAAAMYLAGKLAGFPGDVIVSTWADPVQQNWLGVIRALNPVVSAFGPQQYTNWLALQEGQFAGQGIDLNKLFPEIDVNDLFGGANDPLGVMHQAVSRGRGSIWLWDYSTALSNPNLVKSLTALIGPSTPPTVAKPPVVKPPVVPPVMVPPVAKPPIIVPVPKKPVSVPPVKLPQHTTGQQTLSYTIVSGDTLTGIAVKLKVNNWFSDLFVFNRTTLDNAARSNGQPNSNGGALIYPGTVLHYLQAATHA